VRSVGIRVLGCPVCGAVTYVELIWPDDPDVLHSGIPYDERTAHAEWHERTGAP
jgi:hypothetical protein